MLDTETRIIVADDWQLQLPIYFKTKVWAPARTLRDYVGSNGKLIDVCTCIYHYDDKLYFGDGRPWRHEDVEDIFGDYGERWLSHVFASDDGGKTPKNGSSKYERLRVLHATVQIIGKVEAWAAE